MTERPSAAHEPFDKLTAPSVVEGQSSVGGPAALAVALVVGLAGVVFIAVFNHWFGTVIFDRISQFLAGQKILPATIFGMVFLVLLVVNPLLYLLRPRWRLRRRELVVVFSMWLVAGVVSYDNLVSPIVTLAGTFEGPGIDLPIVTRTGFKRLLPPQLFLDADAATTYYYGIPRRGLEHITLGDVPWRLWVRPLTYWCPFMLAVLVLSSSLVQVVHRQWSKHELLVYPIANVADSLIEPAQGPPQAEGSAGGGGGPWPAIFSSPLFWIGFLSMAFVFATRGLYQWYPTVPRVGIGTWDFSLTRQFPFLYTYCGRMAHYLFVWEFYPFVVALAVLLPTEISLTCGFGFVLTVLGSGVTFLVTGKPISRVGEDSIRMGMWMGLMVFIFAIGWREYLRIARHALTFRRADDPALRNAARACRWFIAAFAGLALLLHHAGLEWFLAVILTGSFSLLVILMARVTAEIGFPTLGNFYWMAKFLPLKMLGAATFGMQGVAVLSVIGGMLDTQTGNSLAATETIYRKLEEKQERGLTRRWFNLLLLVTACLTIGVAIFAHLWDNYNYGAQKEKEMHRVIRGRCITRAANEVSQLQLAGNAERYDRASLGQRLGVVKAEADFWRYFVFGLVIVAACAWARLRFFWWPFHPLPLLLFNTSDMAEFYCAFILGWLIKVGITRIGGGNVYTRSKPLFMGVIMGQVVSACFWMGVAAVYYLNTGVRPKIPELLP